MCNYVLFLPATSWNSVLYFWVVTILSGCFYTVGHIAGTVLHKWQYNGILFTIKTFQLLLKSSISSCGQHKKIGLFLQWQLGICFKTAKKIYFDEGANFHLVRAEGSEFEHRWQIWCIKSFNTESKSRESCIMAFLITPYPSYLISVKISRAELCFRVKQPRLFLVLSMLLP